MNRFHLTAYRTLTELLCMSGQSGTTAALSATSTAALSASTGTSTAALSATTATLSAIISDVLFTRVVTPTQHVTSRFFLQ